MKEKKRYILDIHYTKNILFHKNVIKKRKMSKAQVCG